MNFATGCTDCLFDVNQLSPQTAIGTKLVDPDFGSDGVVNVLAYDVNLVGQTASSTRTRQAGGTYR